MDAIIGKSQASHALDPVLDSSALEKNQILYAEKIPKQLKQSMHQWPAPRCHSAVFIIDR